MYPAEAIRILSNLLSRKEGHSLGLQPSNESNTNLQEPTC